MADKFDALMPQLAKLLRMLGSCVGGEITNTVDMMRQLLKDNGCDMHDLVARLEKSSLDESEMRMIFEAGYNKRIADEAEAAAAPKPFFSASTSPPYSFVIDDDIGDGVNGHGWKDIIGYCKANVDRIPPGKSHDFVESIFRQLVGGYVVPTPRQAPWLRDIFVRYFGGKIV